MGAGRIFPRRAFWTAWALIFPELRGHVITVAALGQDGNIASYSNRCGIAKAFCLAAPGSNMVSAANTGDDFYGTGGSGTSFAAPIVSGSLAVLRQYFRGQLGNTELVARLLATANRAGRYADSDIYGHGLVDLDAATRPFGTMMTGLPGSRETRLFSEAVVELAGGAGAGLAETLAASEMVAFDQLGAPFPVSLAGQVKHAPRSTRLSRTLHARQAGTGFGFGASTRMEVVPGVGGHADELLLSVTSGLMPGATGWWLSHGRHDGRSLGLYRDSTAGRFLDRATFAAPWLSLVRDGLGFGAASRLPSGGRMAFAVMHGAPHQEGYARSGGERGSGVIAEYQPDASRLSWQAGFVREADGFLGMRPRGAFGAASGATTFAGFNHSWPVTDRWQLLSSGYFGWTRPAVGGELLRGVSQLHSSAFSLGLARRSWWRADDWFGMRLSQPLRVESGTADLRLASGRTRYGEVLYRTQRVNLQLASRNLQAEAAWRGPVGGGELFLSLGAERRVGGGVRHDLQFLGALRFERFF